MTGRRLEFVLPGPRSPRLTERVLEVAAMFGLRLDERTSQAWMKPFTLALPARGIVLIHGPSGSGKSSILRAIVEGVRTLRRPILTMGAHARLPDRPLVDLFTCELDEAMRLLARAGLSEARLMLRTPRELSDGQRDRLHIARLFHQADAGAHDCLLIIDEFTARLDRLTAQIIARQARRWVVESSRAHTLICATTHSDVADAMQPDVMIETDLEQPPRLRPVSGCQSGPRADSQPRARARGLSSDLPWDRVRVEPGTIDDYHALAHYHYRGDRPATMERILRAIDTLTGQSIGVLIVSMPRLSCRGRDLALDGRYSDLRRAEAARFINREMRTISRVIVHPRWRGIGVAVALVREALDTASTVYTEALAVMGRANPFFEHAGMRRFDSPPRAEDERLLAAMAHVDLPVSQLAAPRHLARGIEAMPGEQIRFIKRELRRWARGRADSLLGTLRLASLRALAQPVYYIAHREGVTRTTAGGSFAHAHSAQPSGRSSGQRQRHVGGRTARAS